MPEELGIEGKLDYLFKFEYHVPYKDVGSENEICGTLIGIVDDPRSLKPIEGEIEEIKWLSGVEMLSELKEKPKIYCPWLIIALEFLEKSEKTMLEKYDNILSGWISDEMSEVYKRAIKIHLPDDNWRIVE